MAQTGAVIFLPREDGQISRMLEDLLFALSRRASSRPAPSERAWAREAPSARKMPHSWLKRHGASARHHPAGRDVHWQGL